MKDIRLALQISGRHVLALTCWGCGELKDGVFFERYRRKHGEVAYIDRRCGECRWRHLTSPMHRTNYADRVVVTG